MCGGRQGVGNSPHMHSLIQYSSARFSNAVVDDDDGDRTTSPLVRPDATSVFIPRHSEEAMADHFDDTT